MTNYDLVAQKLAELEDLHELDPEQALIQMINLYAEASGIHNHEVCDAIELWIYETKIINLIPHIDKLIEENNDLNNKYLMWIEFLNN